ncbi:MAG TPA: SigE family RNA polymerase sigma factor [Nocardioides sp.]|nr:SigE family RNA polymerase sigma factor [Nocardioides sp.]
MEIEDEAAYTAYVEKAWPTPVRAAVFLGAGVHEAEELAQQTLVRCYGAWDRVSAADNRDAYVYRILLNCLRDQRRSRWWKDRRDAADRLDTPTPDRSEAVATADAIHRALAGLTKPARDVVVLRYFVELSEAQTAEALGIPAGTVKSRLSRALTQLAADDHLLSFKA